MSYMRTGILACILPAVLALAAAGCAASPSGSGRVAPPREAKEAEAAHAVFQMPRPGSNVDFDSDLVIVSGASSPTATTIKIAGRGARGIGVVRLSPDGLRVLVQVHYDAAAFEWHVVDTNGSGLRKISKPTNGPASWSPNGASVAWEDLSAPGGAIVTDLTSGSERRISGASWPAWSPDGSSLACVIQERRTDVDTGPVLSAFRISDGRSTVLFDPTKYAGGVQESAFIHSPIWSEDGRLIAFAYEGNALAGTGIYVLEAEQPESNTRSEPGKPHLVSKVDDVAAAIHNMVWLPGGSIVWAGKDGLMIARRESGEDGWSTKKIASTPTPDDRIEGLQLNPAKDMLFWEQVSSDGQHIICLHLKDWKTSPVMRTE